MLLHTLRTRSACRSPYTTFLQRAGAPAVQLRAIDNTNLNRRIRLPPRFVRVPAAPVAGALSTVEVFEGTLAPCLDGGFIVEDLGAAAVVPGGYAADGVG